jgi:hypothetical protein
VLHPQLGGHEQLLARKTAAIECTSDRFLVLVGGGGVDEPVADLESRGDGRLGLLRGDLEDAKADDRLSTPQFSVTFGIVLTCRLLSRRPSRVLR